MVPGWFQGLADERMVEIFKYQGAKEIAREETVAIGSLKRSNIHIEGVARQNPNPVVWVGRSISLVQEPALEVHGIRTINLDICQGKV
jgi:hypothetical protein